jgi:hypothetical protein
MTLPNCFDNGWHRMTWLIAVSSRLRKNEFNMTAKPSRYWALMLSSAFAVCSICIWLNVQFRVTHKDGSALYPGYQSYFPVQLQRAAGWPNGVVIKVNWATTDLGQIVYDDAVRPNSSRIDHWAAAENIAVAVVLSLTSCILVSAAYCRQFTLRSFLTLASCVALLIALLGPYVQQQTERYKILRHQEQHRGSPFD